MRLLAVLLSAACLAACGDSRVLEEKRGFVTAGLRDPSSAQFRNESLKPSGWLCGELNSKNAYGAYAGFKRFMAKDSASAYMEGMGANGVGETGHQQVSRSLDLRIQALEQAKDLIDAGTLTRDAAEGWVNQRVFEIRWQEHCS